MEGQVERPRAEDTRPDLTLAGHAWRPAVCLAFSLLIWSQAVEAEWSRHRTTFWFEIIPGLIAFVAVIFRRRAPVLFAALIACLSAFSGLASGPATLAAVSLATQRRPGPIIGVGLLNFACAMTYTLYAPFELNGPIWVSVVINLVTNGAMMGWGMYLGSRRELIWTLRHRASRAESEQELRVAQGRSRERERIAREMHDVLAHRITQISMQAGALAFRDDLEADQLQRRPRTDPGQVQRGDQRAARCAGGAPRRGDRRARRGAATDVRRHRRPGQ
ncbi:histidine kinase dimerization/phosphoacceptor domain-containing protein [Nocardioides sp. B-3]|uniref:histidine kinase dimerization/phosphoacceptor domain-containing protein n=1 Tax=Nocardioides sp. B-3 TaxID=2895565 RepID=UPI002153A0E4|nr:histidine kinase dimerization/phosphoacceptor domain-containing protein [Nocardioides sp. B-3]UUZ60083.1 histidine kinase dimerization/phosphoacceptor domain-containing protein [Nocardioides sp. B-3]